MPQLQRFFCSNCKKPIDEVTVDGKPVPLVAYMVVGQVPDTDPVDLDTGSGVKVPSFIREAMQEYVTLRRFDWCINCLANLFGLTLCTAETDPLYSTEQVIATSTKLVGARAADMAALEKKQAPRAAVERHHDEVSRVMLAIKVGRGAMKAPKLPPKAMPAKVPPANVPPTPSLLTHPPPGIAPTGRRRKAKARKPIMAHVKPPE